MKGLKKHNPVAIAIVVASAIAAIGIYYRTENAQQARRPIVVEEAQDTTSREKAPEIEAFVNHSEIKP